jgi:hypothetical protein
MMTVSTKNQDPDLIPDPKSVVDADPDPCQNVTDRQHWWYLSVPTTGTPSTMMTESTPSDSFGFIFMMSGISS